MQEIVIENTHVQHRQFFFLLKHVFTLSGKFDFTFLVLYSLNLPGERVTGEGSLLMTNKEGEFKVHLSLGGKGAS